MSDINKISCAIDLSGPFAGFALSLNSKIIDSIQFEITPRNNSVFLKHFFACVERNALRPDNIGRWVVGIGPGSFAGLRIASSFVSGMCFGKNSEKLGMPTAFPIAAEALKGTSGKACVLFYAASDSLIVCQVSSFNNRYSIDNINLVKTDSLHCINECDIISFVKNKHIVDVCEKNMIEINKAVVLDSFPAARMLEIESDKEYSILDPLYVRPAAAVVTTSNVK